MDKEIYLSALFDYYGVLLTEKQRYYFEDYYFNNYSLAEIAMIYKELEEAEQYFLQVVDDEESDINYVETLNIDDYFEMGTLFCRQTKQPKITHR